MRPIWGMRRANQKTAIVTLRSAPDEPKYFVMGRQLASANEISVEEGFGTLLTGLAVRYYKAVAG